MNIINIFIVNWLLDQEAQTSYMCPNHNEYFVIYHIFFPLLINIIGIALDILPTSHKRVQF
jgi:hypothetical protein